MQETADLHSLPIWPIDHWLRFEPSVNVRWERDHSRDRIADLRHAIIVGLILFNVFAISDFILLPDMIWHTVVLRIVIGTPITLLFFFAISRISGKWREWLVAIGIVNATICAAPMFALSHSPRALFSFSGFFLFAIFANMLLALRFQQACTATALCFAIGVSALFFREDDGESIRLALILQYAIVCLFSLYANYLSERRRTKSYLIELAATLRSEYEEEARHLFQNLSFTDPLTDLPNRRLLHTRLTEWSNERACVTAVMIDVDYFKSFNDALGHPSGDDCLRKIASSLRAVGDEHVIATRYGGEEFTIIMRDKTQLYAIHIVEHILKSIESLCIEHPTRPDGVSFVTASAGVAFSIHGKPWTVDSLISAADIALYRAKNSGRNGFAVAEYL